MSYINSSSIILCDKLIFNLMFINYVMMYKYVIYSFSINLKIHVYMKPYPNCYLLILRTSPESYVEKYENKLQKITGQVKGLKNH